MIVNLNTMCKVRLNELGKVIWLSQVDQLPDDIKKSNPELVAHIKNQITSDNTLEAELWTIMNVFGPYLNPASMPFRVATLEINKNPNFGKHS